MVYYAVYPLLRPRFRYIGDMVVICALAGALMVAIVRLFGHPVCHSCVYETYRVPGTALLYAAGWILGAFIAETQRNTSQFQVHGTYSRTTLLMKRALDACVARMSSHLVLLRCVVVLCGALIMILLSESSLKPKFFPLITADVSLPVFQFLAAIWIATETATPSDAKLWSRLATLGAWSYSLYLCHKVALSLLQTTSFDENGRFAWFVEVALALAISYAFYRLIEKPSHLISQRLRRYTPNSPSAAV
jgi:peptidoglycan/LPS O-acetylase OafA/YrhL